MSETKKVVPSGETKRVVTTGAVYRAGVYYEAGRKLTVGVEEHCKKWQDADPPAAAPVAAAPVAPKAPVAPAKRPSDKDL